MKTTKTSTSTKKTSATKTSKKTTRPIAKAIAKKVVKAPVALSSTVFHDLKTPLTSILSNAQLLRSEDLPSFAADAIVDLAAAAEQMQRMLVNLSDITGDGPQLGQRVRFSVDALFVELRKRCEQTLTDSELTLDIDGGGVELETDGALLGRVLLTLLDNAMMYAPRGSDIALSAEPEAKHVVLRLRDAGAPVPNALRAQVFRPSAAVDRAVATKSRPGLGLGLVFCAQAAEALGGSLALGTETTHSFCLTLPLPRGMSHKAS